MQLIDWCCSSYFQVLLGESYYAERTSRQTVEILKRRGKMLDSQVEALKGEIEDLKVEVSFFDATAAEAKVQLLSWWTFWCGKWLFMATDKQYSFILQIIDSENTILQVMYYLMLFLTEHYFLRETRIMDGKNNNFTREKQRGTN